MIKLVLAIFTSGFLLGYAASGTVDVSSSTRVIPSFSRVAYPVQRINLAPGDVLQCVWPNGRLRQAQPGQFNLILIGTAR